nr:alpha/beta hydrolase domain-containing protein [Frankia sp. EI5c]
MLAGTTTIFRTDQAAPVMDVQTETDLLSILNSVAARQPDNDRFRLWEVPGTAHADAHLLGANAAPIDCGVPINNGPLHVVAKAGLNALVTWVDSGRPPVTAERITLHGLIFKSIRRDGNGNALGGVRTPPVDVPVDQLSGDPGPKLSAICLLLGSTKPLSQSTLAQLYPSRAEYQQRYEAGTDAAVQAGYALPGDRDALLAFAQPGRLPA